MFLIYDPQNSFRFFVVDRFPRWPPLQDKVLTFVQVKSTAYFLLLFCTPVYRPRFLCRPTAFFSTCWSRGTSESSTYGKQRICRCNSASTHFTFRGYRILLSIRNPYINHFTNDFSIHS
jgi:hypothetical protein